MTPRVKTGMVPEPPRSHMFSNARVHNGHIFLSGIHAGSPEGIVGKGDVYAQAQEIFRRLGALAKSCGGQLDDLLTLRIYLTDIADKAAVGRARAEAFSGDFPCSTLVQVSALVHDGLLVEVEAQGIIGAATKN